MIDDDEWRTFKRLIGEPNTWFPKSSNGDKIVPIGNKLIYYDGDYFNPGIRQVIVIDSDNEDCIDFLRGGKYMNGRNKDIPLTHRVQFGKKFLGRGFSRDLLSEIATAMEDMTDEQKEERAFRISTIIDTVKTESQLREQLLKKRMIMEKQ